MDPELIEEEGVDAPDGDSSPYGDGGDEADDTPTSSTVVDGDVTFTVDDAD